jgi:hypothetical protein
LTLNHTSIADEDQRLAIHSLTFRSHSKGAAWINGQTIGRYSNTSPHLTLYAPCVWLKGEDHQIVVFDAKEIGAISLSGLEPPLIDNPAKPK